MGLKLDPASALPHSPNVIWRVRRRLGERGDTGSGASQGGVDGVADRGGGEEPTRRRAEALRLLIPAPARFSHSGSGSVALRPRALALPQSRPR